MPPRLIFRAGVVPFSIKLAAALMVAFQFSAIRMMLPTLSHLAADPSAAFGALVWLILTLWAAYATLRLSRWPLLVLTLASLASLAWVSRLYALGFGPDGFAVFASLVSAWLLSLILILPHWRRLNWRVLGRLPKPSDVAETFA